MSFATEKKAAMEKIGVRDKSHAGAIDEGIEGLLKTINGQEAYYTTSSCAGRIMILEEARLKKDVQWLLASHEPVSLDAVLAALRLPTVRMVWLKAEPFILHVCCRTLRDAERLLGWAHRAGFKHSGIITAGRRIMVEVRGSDRMDVPLKMGVPPYEAYLAFLVEIANRKLEENKKRVKKFENLTGS